MLAADEQRLWSQHGFSADDALEWKRIGASPAQARAWTEAGIQFAGWAHQWIGEGFAPADAAAWVHVTNVYTAGDFRKRGFSAQEAKAWIAHGIRSGLRAEEFKKFGLAPEAAAAWWRRGFLPEEMAPWREAGFDLEESLSWKYGDERFLADGVSSSRTVYELEWAKAWRSAGFTAAEAKRALRLQLPLEEARTWSAAGLALADAVAWKDSGFGPEEAAKLRAQGLGPVEAQEARDGVGARATNEIGSLHADVELARDGSVHVAERFELRVVSHAECFARTLPATAMLHDRDGLAAGAAPIYERLAAWIDGEKIALRATESARDDLTLCLAPSGGLSEGEHTVTLRYVTTDRLITRRHQEELAFEVLAAGAHWPVRLATATVRLPGGAHVIFADGHAGLPERQDFTRRVSATGGVDVVEYTVWRPLREDMSFRVLVAITKGAVSTPLWEQARRFDRKNGRVLTSSFVLALGLLGALTYYVLAWRRVGRDPKPGQLLASFEPPEGASPALVRYLTRGRRVDDVSVAATLVDLAQQGSIDVSEREGTYRLELVDERCGRGSHAFDLLDALFSGSKNIVLGTSRGRTAVSRARRALRRALTEEQRAYRVTNSRYLWPGLLVSAIASLASFAVLDLRDDHDAEQVLMAYSVGQLVTFGLLALLFYALLKAPTHAGRRLMDDIAGYREGLAKMHRGDGRAATWVSPSMARHLPYAMALDLDADGWLLRREAARWFAGRSGPFSVADFTKALRRRAARTGDST